MRKMIGLLVVVLFVRSCDGRTFDTSKSDCTVHDLYADCSLRGLQHAPDHLPKNITCLNLLGNNISKIDGKLWKTYPALKKLSLARNNFEYLDDSTFTGLEHLKMLDLSLNKIRYNNISDNAFTPLLELTFLDLKQALPDILPTERYPLSLAHVRKLTTLRIDGIGKQSLPVLSNLKYLYMSGQYGRCEIPFLASRNIEKVKSIEQVFVSNCSTEKIESAFLDAMPNISALDLSWNMKMGFDPVANICVGIANHIHFKRLNLNNVFGYFDGDCVKMTPENVGLLNASHLELLTFEGNNIVRISDGEVNLIPKTLKYISFRDNMLMFGTYVNDLISSGVIAKLVYYDSSQQFHSHTPVHFKSDAIVSSIYKKKHGLREFVSSYDCENMFTSYHFKDYFQLFDERLNTFNISPIASEREGVPSTENEIEYLDLSENLPGTIYVTLKMFEKAPFVKFLNLSNNYNGIPYLNSNELFLNYSNLRYLDLSSNRIEHIHMDVFKHQKRLQHLYLSNNKIRKIYFDLTYMPKLRYLNLCNNSLEKMSEKTMGEVDKLNDLRINIVYNNIQCYCKHFKFIIWLMENQKKFESFEITECMFENSSTVLFGDLNLAQYKYECSPLTYYFLILGLSLGILTFIIIVSCGIVYRFKWNLRYLYYMTKIKLIGQYQPLENREYERDVFVSYANEDHSFVTQKMIPELEVKGNISLLVHERDFLAGEYVADNILKAITSTRKTLVILTKAYIQSQWCMYELNMARIEAADTGRNVLCVILKEDIPTKYLSVEVIDIIKKKTYLEFPEDEEHVEGFWERLRSTLLVAN